MSANASKHQSNVMPILRERVFAARPEDIGLDRGSCPLDVWGFLMETGVTGGNAYSLLVLADGTTSLYFSMGGGVIGAGRYEQVRNESMNLLACASQYLSSIKPVAAHPLPSAGQVRFYFLSYRGLFSYSAREELLGQGVDKFSKLFFAGHRVVSAVRRLEKSWCDIFGQSKNHLVCVA